ncbi:MAG: hypothetical protein DCC71_14490 [Proteobacteria bacterium]|nr:MAG: hypothetical protein DCC71_14490 [Pseudomonadota bacterium]
MGPFAHQLFSRWGRSQGWARLVRSLRAEIDEEKSEAYRGTASLPFEAGAHRRVAVKIADDRGIESLRIFDLEDARQPRRHTAADGPTFKHVRIRWQRSPAAPR